MISLHRRIVRTRVCPDSVFASNGGLEMRCCEGRLVNITVSNVTPSD